MEKPEQEQPKEKDFEPREGEDLREYFERIGEGNVEIVEDLEEYKMPRLRKERPLAINSEGSWIINDQNIGNYFGKKDIKTIKDIHGEKAKDYQINKEAFENPQQYLGAVVAMIKEGKAPLVIDQGAFDTMEEWGREKKKEEPAASKEKAPTLDEQIEQKKKEIEDIEQGYNIYYSPAVQDLLGLYYKEKHKGLKGLKKELEELEKKKSKEGAEKPAEKPVEEPIKEEEKPAVMTVGEIKEPEGMPEEVPEEPTTEEQLKEIRKELRKITRKISRGGVLGRAELEKEQYELEKMKEKAEERLRIEKRLKKISKKIEQSGVLGRSKLEKEQKKLEKRLKKLK